MTAAFALFHHTDISYGRRAPHLLRSSQKREMKESLQPDVKAFTVLIADDHPMVREGLTTLLNRHSDIQVIGTANDGQQAVDLFFAKRPDVVLLDLRMPVMDGLQALGKIRSQFPNARAVMLTTYDNEENIYRALQVGAQGYLLKDAPLEELVKCIRTVALGKRWIPADIGAKLARRIGTRDLTPREMEVLRGISAGKSNKEIGSALDITEATVKVHVTHLLEKLNVTGRTEAIAVAVKRGLVEMAG